MLELDSGASTVQNPANFFASVVGVNLQILLPQIRSHLLQTAKIMLAHLAAIRVAERGIANTASYWRIRRPDRFTLRIKPSTLAGEKATSIAPATFEKICSF